jgi:hypothetical protein
MDGDGLVMTLRFVNSLRLVIYFTRSAHECAFPPSLLKRRCKYVCVCVCVCIIFLSTKSVHFAQGKSILIPCYYL